MTVKKHVYPGHHKFYNISDYVKQGVQKGRDSKELTLHPRCINILEPMIESQIYPCTCLFNKEGFFCWINKPSIILRFGKYFQFCCTKYFSSSEKDAWAGLSAGDDDDDGSEALISSVNSG